MPWQPNKLERERLDKLQHLKERGVEPYPNRVKRTHTMAAAKAAFEAVEHEGEVAESIEATVTGRIRSIRTKGKVSFADIEDGTSKLQLFLRQDAVGEETYELFKRDLDLGDFVEASGTMVRTKTGEISVAVVELKVLAKAVSPLPVIKEQEVDGKIVKYGGFSDIDERYRQRYMDLASNDDVREEFRIRARTVNAVRQFLDSEGFLEVETPILQPVYGGAAARALPPHYTQLNPVFGLFPTFHVTIKHVAAGY